jgi:hypothetical protein
MFWGGTLACAGWVPELGSNVPILHWLQTVPDKDKACTQTHFLSRRLLSQLLP